MILEIKILVAFIEEVRDRYGDKKEASGMMIIFCFLTCGVHRLIGFVISHQAVYFFVCYTFFKN